MRKRTWLNLIFAATLLAWSSAQASAGVWDFMYPEKGGNLVESVDPAFDFINWVTAISFVGTIVVMLGFAIKYRRTDPSQKALSQASHSTALEIGWSIPPFVICIVIFYMGFQGWMTSRAIPADVYTVEVSAQKWAWQFRHPSGLIDSNVLQIPAGRPVRLVMNSSDVLHSLFVPAFRVKRDVVPGRTHELWFIANKATNHTKGLDPGPADKLTDSVKNNGHILYCTEYCGTNHSMMMARVVVHDKDWVAPALPEPEGDTAERGEFIYKSYGACFGCHSLDGTKKVGPSFKGLFGRKENVRLPDGSVKQVDVDDDYLIESITNPSAKIVEGYLPQMPLRPDINADPNKVKALINFIKSVK